uniref:Uncharacterized protein n=1 Tax=Arion vulgaris TaxID=1028688 RepID=A0A0B6Y1A8_9EUPU
MQLVAGEFVHWRSKRKWVPFPMSDLVTAVEENLCDNCHVSQTDFMASALGT